MSPIRVAGTRIFKASAFCEIPRGARNSSRSISPGCVVTLRIFQPETGLLMVIGHLRRLRSVVINYFDIMCSVFFPYEADPVLIIDSDAVLSRPITLQCLQTVSRR